MKKPSDLKGKKFGRLTVVSKYPVKSSGGAIRWRCVCDCGAKSVVISSNLTSGSVKSCGCLQKDTAKGPKPKHGMAYSSEYNTWKNIRQLCGNKNNTNFKYYGALGIIVCERWQVSFENFLEDMGPKPSEKSKLLRFDNSLGFDSLNCFWGQGTENTITDKEVELI